MTLIYATFYFDASFQTSDILYYEVLDIPLPELQCLKTLKVAFHHATKDEVRIMFVTSSYAHILFLSYVTEAHDLSGCRS
jgi:hypothetical protein